MALETHTLLKARAGIAALTFAALAVLVPTREAAAATVVFSGTGVIAAAVTPTVDAFRSALGGLNPNVVGSFGSGRREINWDGVPDTFAAPNLLPGNFFNVNSPRGVVLSTPGTGLQVSASSASGVPIQFGNINPAYPSNFEPFSPQRLFTALSSNVVDVNFFVPGSTNVALTRGFGVVFSDVDVASTTSLTFFGANNEVLGTFSAPAIAGNETFSFLGVAFDSPLVSLVRILSGNASLGAGQFDPDVVAMDDFIYGEPVPQVPLPAALPLFATGLGALGLLGWRRKRCGGRLIVQKYRAGFRRGRREAVFLFAPASNGGFQGAVASSRVPHYGRQITIHWLRLSRRNDDQCVCNAAWNLWALAIYLAALSFPRQGLFDLRANKSRIL